MRFLPLLVLATLALPAVPASSPSDPRGTFWSADGFSKVIVTLTNVCGGDTTLRVEVHRRIPVYDPVPEVRYVSGENLLVPDPCQVACVNCVVPFAWTFVGDDGDVTLQGGGVTGGLGSSWTLEGAFQEGVIQFGGGSGIVIAT